MAGELITGPTMAIGVAGYLGSELFKPTLARMGESIRDFFTARVRKVFEEADVILEGASVPPSLEPGFLALFIQRVSFSEDQADLTRRWANLLVDASRAFSNKHVNYVEILSQLGPVEVRLLDSIVGDRPLAPSRPSNLQSSLRILLGNVLAGQAPGREAAAASVGALLRCELPWPAAVMSAEVPYSEEGHSNSAVGGVGRAGWDSIAIDILIRQRLLEELSLDLETSLPPPRVSLLLATGLGLDFVRACRGLPEPDETGA